LAVQLLQLTAAIYLAAGLLAALGLALETQRLERPSVALLILGALIHGVSFSQLHVGGSTPPLTNLNLAISFMSWVATVFFLVLLRWSRLQRLVVIVAPAAFLGAFFAALRFPGADLPTITGTGSWPHAHVLLGSAGIALLSVSGLVGMIFLAEHRRLKSKRPVARRFPLPSLEALDRVNRLALAAGFPLLTLGLVTGMIWVNSVSGTFWSGTYHETLLASAWIMYTVLTAARFGASQGSRQAAVSAVGAFAFLFFAVIGVELFL
jgi:ABC-type transport system involved in cytochrome c biogenesis permease subunit